MVGLWINEKVIATGEVQREQAVTFRKVQAECFLVEFFLLRNVSRRKTAECFYCLSTYCAPSDYFFVLTKFVNQPTSFFISTTNERAHSGHIFRGHMCIDRSAERVAKVSYFFLLTSEFPSTDPPPFFLLPFNF
jgi:hypothetical protein